MSDAAPIELAGMFLEWQRIEDAKAELAEQSKDLFKVAKDKGYDTKAMRAVFREKRIELEASPEDAAKAEEAEAMNDLYRSALDRGLTARARPAHDAREIIEEFPLTIQSYSEAKGRGFVAKLTDEQMAAALAYDGEDSPVGEITGNQESGPVLDGSTGLPAGSGSDAIPATHSQAHSPEPADIAGEAGSSSPVSPATNSGSATPAGADGHPGEPSDDARAAEPGAEAPRIGAQSSRAVTSSDDDIPAFIKQDKPDCLKLKDGHCRLSFATSALCAECNQRRTMARALA